MRDMKESGVEWLGVIPTDWKTTKLKYLGEYINGYAFKPDDWSDIGKPIIRIQDLTKSTQTTNFYEGNIAEKYLVQNGDILVSWAATLDAFVWTKGEGWLNQHIFKAVPNQSLITSSYFYWLIKVAMYHMNNDNKHGIVMQHVTLSVFNNFSVALPTLDEQVLIAEILQHKCTQVDQLISNVQSQIEKLKAYKQSLITEVVTKGLDPAVPMKDSGVEWFEQINASYSMQAICSLFKIKKDIIGHEPETVLSITQRGLRVKNINENEGQMANSYANYQIVCVGDFAMNHMDLLTGGIGIAEIEGVTSPDYRVFVKRNPESCSKYFLYVFEIYYRNKIFYAFGQGAANMGRWRLPAQNFNTIRIPVPSIDEQFRIAAYLDEKCSQIDHLIAIKQAKIEKLEQYKRSLIYEYVTGKREVS